MNNAFLLPVAFLKFWYYESPKELLGFFGSVNSAFFQLFSLPLFLKTFFKPIKNEYREGLVGFSIALGVSIKSILIIVDTMLLLIILTFEITVFFSFLAFPVLTFWIIFL